VSIRQGRFVHQSIFSRATFRRSKNCSTVQSLRFEIGNHLVARIVTPVNTTLACRASAKWHGADRDLYGVNAPKKIGKHFGPYPYSTLVPIIKEQNVLFSSNSAAKAFFSSTGFPKNILTTLTLPRSDACGCSFVHRCGSGAQYYRRYCCRQALSADFTNEGLNTFGYQLPVMSTFEAGRRFYKIGRSFDFTLFEYFFSDKAGHSQR